jgi:outer membrane protein TolC
MNSNEVGFDVVYLSGRLVASAMFTVALTWAIFSLGQPKSAVTEAQTQSDAAPVEAESQEILSLPEVVVVANRSVDAGR